MFSGLWPLLCFNAATAILREFSCQLKNLILEISFESSVQICTYTKKNKKITVMEKILFNKLNIN